MDFELCRTRHLSRREGGRSDVDREKQLGVGHWHTGDEFDRWFYEDSGFEDDVLHIRLERIPESFRGLV
jgi:hypothetical protein